MAKKQAPVAQFHGVGRRKEAVARVWLKADSHGVVVNGKTPQEYFPTTICVDKVYAPLKLSNQEDKVGIEVNVCGGGFNGQAEATRLAVSRALLELDASHRPVLKAQGFLTVDARVVERKKPGQKKARKKFQFVKR